MVDIRAPLSIKMARYAASKDPTDLDSFLLAFAAGRVGVVATGGPPGGGVVVSDGSITVGSMVHPALPGSVLLAAFADPSIYAKRFGGPMNADLEGSVLLQMLIDGAGDAILVNSALTEQSHLIPPEHAARALQLSLN